MYIVHELYDVVGHYGCSATEEVIAGVFATKKHACDFKREHHNPFVYGCGKANEDLRCNFYVVTEVNPAKVDRYNRLYRDNLCENCQSKGVCEGERR